MKKLFIIVIMLLCLNIPAAFAEDTKETLTLKLQYTAEKMGRMQAEFKLLDLEFRALKNQLDAVVAKEEVKTKAKVKTKEVK